MYFCTLKGCDLRVHENMRLQNMILKATIIRFIRVQGRQVKPFSFSFQKHCIESGTTMLIKIMQNLFFLSFFLDQNG